MDRLNLDNHKAKIYEMVGEEFNIDSPKQVGEVLFDKLKLSIFADNLFNSRYVADAWSYGDSCGYFPQAPINAMVRISYSIR